MAAYRLGLALSGGSIKGFAHLGVMSYMAEAGIQPEIIAGTSAGSIMGAFYASGYAPQEIYDLFSKVGFLKATRGGWRISSSPPARCPSSSPLWSSTATPMSMEASSVTSP